MGDIEILGNKIIINCFLWDQSLGANYIDFPLKLLGSMLDVIKHRKKKGGCEDGLLDEAVIASVLREVLKGLDYFHSQGLIHRCVDNNMLISTCKFSPCLISTLFLVIIMVYIA